MPDIKEGSFSLNSTLKDSKPPTQKDSDDSQNTSNNNNFATILPKYCVWTMVASGGASILYPFTIFELTGASDFVNSYAQYFGAMNEEQLYEYARDLADVGVYGGVPYVPRPEAAATQEPRVNPAPAAAPAAGDDEGDPNNRDWLHWLGTAIRAFIMFSFIYVNGSLHRLVLLVGCYFLIKYYFRYQNEIENAGINLPQRQQPQDADHQQQARHQNGDNPSHLQRLVEDSVNDNQNNQSNGSSSSSNTSRRSNDVPSGLFLTLLKALFTSLIPNPTPTGERA